MLEAVPEFEGTIAEACGPGSSVGIATGYGLEGSGIESRWVRDFPHLSRPALEPTQPPVQWVRCLSRGKKRQRRDADPSPPSSAVVKKEYCYTSTPPIGHTACTRVHFTFTLAEASQCRTFGARC